MQLDHFRPTARDEFKQLRNDPQNLHYACGRCNLLKSDHWPSTHPSLSHDGNVGFVDPFSDDRQCYFRINQDGQITALKPPASYVIQLLKLDREHLRKIREKRILVKALRQRIENEWERIFKELDTGKLTKERLQEIRTTYGKLISIVNVY